MLIAAVLLSAFVIVSIFQIGLDIYSTVISRNVDYFEDVSEFDNFENIYGKNTKFTRYDDPSGDKYLSGAEYDDFRAGRCEYGFLGVDVFLYEFKTVEDSLQYIENYKGSNEYEDSGEHTFANWGKEEDGSKVSCMLVIGRKCYVMYFDNYLSYLVTQSRLDSVFSNRERDIVLIQRSSENRRWSVE